MTDPLREHYLGEGKKQEEEWKKFNEMLKDSGLPLPWDIDEALIKADERIKNIEDELNP